MFRFSPIILFTILCCGCTSYNRTADGLRYFGQAQYDQAMVAFQAALSSNPENPDAYYNIAATYHQSAKVYLQTGQVAVSQQHYDEADKYYRLCLSKDSNHTAAYRGLAVLFMERQNPEAAFQLLVAWEDMNLVSPEPKLELARLYQEYSQICQLQGRTDVAQTCMNAAVTKLQQVLSVDPNNFRALRAMGYLREQSGDIINAIADYRRSLQSNPAQKDLSDRITALEQGAGYNPAPYVPGTSGSVSGSGATVYNSGSSSSSISSALGRNPF